MNFSKIKNWNFAKLRISGMRIKANKIETWKNKQQIQKVELKNTSVNFWFEIFFSIPEKSSLSRSLSNAFEAVIGFLCSETYRSNVGKTQGEDIQRAKMRSIGFSWRVDHQKWTIRFWGFWSKLESNQLFLIGFKFWDCEVVDICSFTFPRLFGKRGFARKEAVFPKQSNLERLFNSNFIFLKYVGTFFP